MVKVIECGQKRRVTCNHCGALLELEQNDLKTVQTGMNEYEQQIICPACNKTVAVNYKPDRFERREEEKIQYPMLEKLKRIEEKSHLCGEFFDFIRSKYVLFDPSVPREQFGYVGSGDYINPEKLLAEFFDIDMEQAEEERQQILKYLHSQN